MVNLKRIHILNLYTHIYLHIYICIYTCHTATYYATDFVVYMFAWSTRAVLQHTKYISCSIELKHFPPHFHMKYRNTHTHTCTLCLPLIDTIFVGSSPMPCIIALTTIFLQLLASHIPRKSL